MRTVSSVCCAQRILRTVGQYCSGGHGCENTTVCSSCTEGCGSGRGKAGTLVRVQARSVSAGGVGEARELTRTLLTLAFLTISSLSSSLLLPFLCCKGASCTHTGTGRAQCGKEGGPMGPLCCAELRVCVCGPCSSSSFSFCLFSPSCASCCASPLAHCQSLQGRAGRHQALNVCAYVM